MGRPGCAAADVGENLSGSLRSGLKLSIRKGRRNPNKTKVLRAENTETLEILTQTRACGKILLRSCWNDSERRLVLAISSTLKFQESEVGRLLEERDS